MTIIKDLFYVLILFIVVYIGFYLTYRNESLPDKMNRYDCSLSEFSPDFPSEVRNECRRRSLERINQQKAQ